MAVSEEDWDWVVLPENVRVGIQDNVWVLERLREAEGADPLGDQVVVGVSEPGVRVPVVGVAVAVPWESVS